LNKGASEVITGSFPNLASVCNHLLAARKNIILGCSAWKDRFNMEDTLFAGAVIHRIKHQFTVHCDSSLMAEDMYCLHKDDLYEFVQKTTHWHRLASYGLEKDLHYCVTPNVADVLPVYHEGALIANY